MFQTPFHEVSDPAKQLKSLVASKMAKELIQEKKRLWLLVKYMILKWSDAPSKSVPMYPACFPHKSGGFLLQNNCLMQSSTFNHEMSYMVQDHKFLSMDYFGNIGELIKEFVEEFTKC